MAKGQQLNGRQLAFMIWQTFKRDETEIGMSEFRALQNLRMNGDNLSKFVHDWDSCLFGL